MYHVGCISVDEPDEESFDESDFIEDDKEIISPIVELLQPVIDTIETEEDESYCKSLLYFLWRIKVWTTTTNTNYQLPGWMVLCGTRCVKYLPSGGHTPSKTSQ